MRDRCHSPGGSASKEPTCKCRRCKKRGFNPWVRKTLWRRKWQLAPVFLPGEFHGQKSPVGYIAHGLGSQSRTRARARAHTHTHTHTRGLIAQWRRPCDPMTVASQAPLSLGLPRQEHLRGLPFPSPWNLPDPGSEPASPECTGGFFTTEPPGNKWLK